jgi:hypothetical protein
MSGFACPHCAVSPGRWSVLLRDGQVGQAETSRKWGFPPRKASKDVG